MIEHFDSIRPYSEQETLLVVKRLFSDPKFVQTLSIFEDKINVDGWVKEIMSCKTQLEFHLTFANRVFHYFTDKTCSKICYSGLEKIDPNKQYLFVGNHRDIVLDSALLQIYYFQNGFEETRIAIGDNLVSTPLLVELARIHKMFLVLRSGTLKEKINHTHHLSSYIYHSLFNDKESVWIAQRNGRTKNGDDKTQQGLLKMLTYADPQNPMQLLKQMLITPVTVSYQYESCAQMKARELALSEKTPYVKATGEDFKSIVEGVSGYKGEVHFAIGDPLQQEFDMIPEGLNFNEKLNWLCRVIDRKIYENYYIFPQNHIAFDIQENSNRYASFYTDEEKSLFMSYLDKQSSVSDVPKEKMMRYLLDIYVNPVKNKIRSIHQDF